ncbi:MAG: phosphoglucosamine mutase, partial [bacterium]
GGELIRTAVGEINVVRGMQRQSAVVGGEGNGGVILPELHYTRDAPMAAVLILQNLLEVSSSLSESVAKWPRYTIQKKKVNFPRENLPKAYSVLKLEMLGAQLDETDGLRMSWPEENKWVHVRPSGTEPVIRLIAEACNQVVVGELLEEVAAHLEEVR